MAKIFSVLWWLGTALVFGAAGIRFGLPAQDQYAFYLAWAGIACWVLYAASQWREIAGTFSGRQARYGTLAGTSVLIVLGILVAVNYIGKQQNKRWDLTANKQFSLSDQSRNVLAKLDGPLQIMVFAEETAVQGLRDRMNEYEYASSQVTTEYIDPDRQRAIAQQNGVQQYGTIVVNYKGRSERTTASTEQDITNTIIKAVSGQQRKVYFTSGHGEKNITSAERDGYATIVEALKQENYGVETVVLAQTGSVPEDAAVVIVAGPQTDFFAPEVDALRTYLGKAGQGVTGLLHGDVSQFVLQLGGATLCAAYAFGLTYGVFKVVNAIRSMRVTKEAELEGLDVPQFGMLAYPEEEGIPAA